DIYEKYDIKDVERLIGMKIPQEVVEGFEPDPTIRRRDQEELKLKSEHKKVEVKRAKKSYKKPDAAKKTPSVKKAVTSKKRKTTKRD
ncbi:MAG: ATP-dependent helicase, partial [Sulfurimonas sp.]|nr:ATP-dependent helicase [Sulfurimonas sp.]